MDVALRVGADPGDARVDDAVVVASAGAAVLKGLDESRAALGRSLRGMARHRFAVDNLLGNEQDGTEGLDR